MCDVPVDRFEIREMGKEKWDSMAQSEKDPYIKAAEANVNRFFQDLRERSIKRKKKENDLQ